MKRLELVFVAVGVLLLAGAGLWVYLTVYLPQTWPQAEAVVVSSRVINPGGPGQYTPELVLRCRDGDSDRDVTLIPSWTSGSYDLVRAHVDRYLPGQTIPVAVNPSDPEDLRYELGVTLMNMIGPGALAVLGLIFGGIGAWFLRPSKPRRGDDSLTWRRVAWAFGLIGIVICAIGTAMVVSDVAMLHDWPVVEAQVVESRIVTASQGMQQSSVRRATLVDTEVTFRYMVDQRTYTNHTVYGVSSSDSAAVRDRLGKYAPDTRHIIRYRPGDPNVIRFDLDSTIAVFFLSGGLLLMGLLFVGLGIMVWMAFGRSRQGL